MNVYFSFPNKIISFKCSTCAAVCCFVNNYLLMNESQFNAAKKENPLAIKFSKQVGEAHYLRTGKQCWFLKENKCSIHTNSGENYKPTSCSIYPLRVWLLNNNLAIVDYIPCPDFSYNTDNPIIHKDYDNQIQKYINLIGINQLSKFNIEISQERLNYEKSFRDNYQTYMKEFITKNKKNLEKFEQTEQDYIYKLLWLYPQIRMRPSVLNLPEKWSLVTFEIYYQLILKTINLSWGDGGLQNAYSIILNEFNNIMEEKYSFERG